MDNSIKQDLWRYALGRWQDKDFERACLHLQDDYQVPVALLLSFNLEFQQEAKAPKQGPIKES